MNIENFNYLMELNKYRSISQASKNLYISSQQLSRILAGIEKEYNIQIFERLNTGLRPTEEGREFLQKAAALIRQNDLLHQITGQTEVAHARDTLKGTLNIFSPSYAWTRLIQCITAFAAENPQVNITHTIEEPAKISESLLQMPNAVGFNLSIVGTDPETAARMEVPNFFPEEDFAVTNLSNHKLRIYCADHHPLAAKSKISLFELNHQPVILYKPYPEKDHFLLQLYKLFNITPNIKYHIADKDLFFSLLHSTNCIHIGGNVPKIYRSDSLCSIPLVESITQDFDLVIPKAAETPPLITAFREFCLNFYYLV